MAKTWYPLISQPSTRTILHLLDIRCAGAVPQPELRSPEDVRAFLQAHPEIDAVNVYDSRFPQRPILIEKFDEKFIWRLFEVRAVPPDLPLIRFDETDPGNPGWILEADGAEPYELEASDPDNSDQALLEAATRLDCSPRRIRVLDRAVEAKRRAHA